MNKIILLLLLLSSVLIAQAATKNAKKTQIIEAKGYSFLSEDKSIKDIREDAFVNAKRNCLEKSGIFLKSITIVREGTLYRDIINSYVEGHLKILESKDIGIKSDNKYHVWIKAEVTSNVQSDPSPIKLGFSDDYFQSINGQLVNLNKLLKNFGEIGKDEYLLFLFWDYYCGPCLIELEFLDKEVLLENIRVITINMDIPEKLKARTLAKNKIKKYNKFLNLFPLNNKQRLRLKDYYKLSATPFTMLVNDQKKIVWSHLGFPNEKEKQQDFAKKLLSTRMFQQIGN